MILEPIPFLANIVFVACADGKLSASELGQLDSICTELKFKKGDFNAAKRLVEQGNYKMTPVGAFADRVRNLELILRVVYADDDLSEAEAAIVSDFCKAIGIYDDQLEKMRGEVLSSMKQLGRLCPSCGTSADAEACFCPNCGSSLTATDEAVQIELTIPSSGLSIEFAESTAASFPKALELAKLTDGFQSCKKNKKTWYLAVYPSGNLEVVMPLVESLSAIRNRRLYIDGQEKLWEDVFSFAWCATGRATAYRPIEYCFGKDEKRFNLWGCKQANMEWIDGATWFCYGRWEKVGIIGGKFQWRFDKDRIRHELAAKLFRYRFCPHIKMQLYEAVLKYLPDTVVPDSDRNWGYHQIYEEVPGSIKGVQEARMDGYSFKNEYWADGVRPKGFHAFGEILSKALKELGDNTISVSDLLK